MRGEGNDAENDETLELAKKYLVNDGGVVAVDIAGAEALYPTSKYKDLFARQQICLPDRLRYKYGQYGKLSLCVFRRDNL